MSIADQFTADATAAGAAQPQQMTLAQQFAADAAAGSQAQATQAKQTATNSAQAADLSVGGASPDTWNQLQQIGAGAAHGIGSMVNNAANFVEKGVAAGANAIPGVKGSTVGNWLNNTANSDVMAQAQTDQAFKQNASPGAQAAGFVAPMLLPIGGATAGASNAIRSGVQALPMMSGAVGRAVGAGLGNAATGAALSTAAPIDPNGGDYWSQVGKNALVGGGIGAALPAAVGAGRVIGSNAWNAVQPIINPQGYVGQQFAAHLGDDAANVAQNIRTAPQFVPGSMPTTAQVGANPALVATEKAAANSNPAFKIALAQRGVDNNDARWGALMGVAQDQPALDAATQARAAAAGPLYDAAHQAQTNVGPAFMRYAQIPELQEAMQRAHSNAALDAAVGRGVAPVWPTPPVPGVSPGSKAINGAALDYTSRALDDMITEAQRAGNNSRVGALQALQQRVDGWTQSYIPGVKQASDTYARMSVPVNTMEVGQGIANGLGTRSMNAGGAPEIGLMPFRSALTKAMNSGNAEKYGIDANGLNTLQGIGQDLQRSSVSNSLKSPGSDTAYNAAANGWLARNLYGQNFGGATGLGRVLGAAAATATGHPWIGAGILTGGAQAGQMVGNRLNGQLSNFLLNPNALLPYLDARAAPAVNGMQQALPGLLQRQLLPAVVGGVTRGGLVNSQ